MERSSCSISFSVAVIWDGSDDSRLLPSIARKSDVKLLRSPSTRVFGSHSSAMSSDRLLKLLSREMLNKPRITTNRKKNRKTKVRWNLIERGWRIVPECQVDETIAAKRAYRIEYSKVRQTAKPGLQKFLLASPHINLISGFLVASVPE